MFKGFGNFHVTNLLFLQTHYLLKQPMHHAPKSVIQCQALLLTQRLQNVKSIYVFFYWYCRVTNTATRIVASQEKGLTVNCKKTECTVINKKEGSRCDLRIGDAHIKQVQKFNYRGSVITSDGRYDTENKKRIGMAKDTFQKLEKILRNHKLAMETKKRVLDAHVMSILMYGSECWTISPQMRQRREADEKWFYWRMLRISWIEHKSNEEVLRMASAERNLLKNIRRQLEFLHHILRKEGLENLCLTGRIEGRRARGKQRSTYLDSLVNWMKNQVSARERVKISSLSLLKTSRDRKLWKAMIAKVLTGYGTWRERLILSPVFQMCLYHCDLLFLTHFLPTSSLHRGGQSNCALWHRNANEN